jgi:hypothetical protein
LAVLAIFHNVQFTGGAPARGDIFLVSRALSDRRKSM